MNDYDTLAGALLTLILITVVLTMGACLVGTIYSVVFAIMHHSLESLLMAGIYFLGMFIFSAPIIALFGN